MAKKLYIGGLPFSTTQEEMAEYFGKAGNVVSAMVVKDKMTGRSRGFGFVEMSTEEEGDAAISMFNGQDFGGRNIIVSEARPMTENRPPRRFGNGFSGRE